MAFKYKRCLIKLSGEALSKQGEGLFCEKKLHNIAKQLIRLAQEGLEIAVVLGGGNIWRGAQAPKLGMDKVIGDYIGMLATCMNALALESVIKKLGFDKVIVCSALTINKIMEPFFYKKARKRLDEHYIVILASGAGLPCFTTDTAAILRAIELNIKLVLLAKNNIDGVYTKDPHLSPDAKHIQSLTARELVINNLKVIDHTASTLASTGKINIEVFNINSPDNIYQAAHGQAKTTKINFDLEHQTLN